MMQGPSAITFSAALDEETISHLHDVCLVHCCHLVSPILMSVLEGILSYASTGNPGDDLQHEQIYQACSAAKQLRIDSWPFGKAEHSALSKDSKVGRSTHLQGLNNSRNNLMLQTTVLSFCVLSDGDQVDIVIPGLESWNAEARPYIGI